MESAKLKALLYADIFDYPLTEAELEKWQVADSLSTPPKKFQAAKKTNGYCHLRGRKQLVSLRKKREEISKKKLEQARKAVLLLKRIPLIKMIAVTGALSMQNSKKGDDIDLLIIAQKGLLWLTRLFSTILLDLARRRRRPNDKNFNNKICLNMFLEDGYLSLPKNEQDLYEAHEVCQAKPIFERDDTYRRFLRVNSWAKKFLPNAPSRVKGEGRRVKRNLFPIPYPLSPLGRKLCLYPLELLAKFLQLWYMKQRRTNEVISTHMLRFHPKDYRQKILQEYQKRLRLYGKKG